MKLATGAEKRQSRPKAVEVVKPQGEVSEPNEFFDYQRDVPAWIRRVLETKPAEFKAGVSYFTDQAFIRSILGLSTPVDLVEVQDYVSVWYESRASEDWSETPVQAGDNRDLTSRLFLLVQLNEANALLPMPDQRLAELSEKTQIVLAPQVLETVGEIDLDALVDLLYCGYQLHPSQRAEYSRIARERLEKILAYYRRKWTGLADDLAVTYYGVSTLAILLPEAKETLRQFVAPFKKRWMTLAKQDPLDNIDQDLPGLYCFMILAQDEVRMDEFGRLQVKKIHPIQKSPNLPMRSQL